MANILIVDDSVTYRKTLRKLLEEGGHTIVGEAGDGVQAIDQYQKLKPDLITLDITMPVMNGIDALKWIMEYDSSALVVMVSSSAQASKIKESIELGALDFLPKPFQSQKVLEAVNKILSAVNSG